MDTEEKDFVDILDEQIESQIEVDEREQEMARKLGIVEEEKEEVKKVEEKQEEKKEEKVEEVNPDELFDKMYEDPAKEHEKLQSFSKENKAFYHKWKKDKQKRQEYEASHEMLQLKLKQYELEIEALKNRPKDIDSLLSEEEQKAKSNEPLTKAEFEAKMLEEKTAREDAIRRSQRLDKLEKEAKEKYADFDDALNAAIPVLQSNPHYYNLYMSAVNDPQGRPDELVYNLGKLYMPKKVEEVKTEEIKTKTQTTASLQTAPSSTKRRVNYDDLTPADAAKLSASEWRALPRKVKDRILMEVS